MMPMPRMAQPADIIPDPGATLTFDQSYALMNDANFRGRVQVACITYAQVITGEGSTVPAHNTRLRWAQSVFQGPAIVAAQITPPTVMNINVQLAGSAIDDPSLQAAVQYVVDANL